MQTGRLRLRQFTEADLSNLLELNSDPEVMRFITGGKPDSLEQAQTSLQRILGYYKDGSALGLWAAELLDSGEFIGWFCLKPLPGFDEIELGYRLRKRYWGKGYATEGARFLVDYGFRRAGLSRIAAIVDPGNFASRRVLEKAGLAFERRTRFRSPVYGSERDVDLFAIAA